MAQRIARSQAGAAVGSAEQLLDPFRPLAGVADRPSGRAGSARKRSLAETRLPSSSRGLPVHLRRRGLRWRDRQPHGQRAADVTGKPPFDSMAICDSRAPGLKVNGHARPAFDESIPCADVTVTVSHELGRPLESRPSHIHGHGMLTRSFAPTAPWFYQPPFFRDNNDVWTALELCAEAELAAANGL